MTERGGAFHPNSFYSYPLHPAADVPGLVQTYSGPQGRHRLLRTEPLPWPAGLSRP